jgi:hypothetical protein
MKSKKLVIILATATAGLSLVLISIPESARNQKVKAEYASSHSLRIAPQSNAPTDLNAYKITDSGMNLHTGGYVYAQASRKTDLSYGGSFNYTDINFVIVASGGRSGSFAANGILFDIWANGITPVFADEAELKDKTSSLTQKMYAYTDGGYPSVGTTAVESYNVDGVDGFPTSFITTGINHVRIELSSISTANVSYELGLKAVSLTFNC